jgi:hypothetical protein
MTPIDHELFDAAWRVGVLDGVFIGLAASAAFVLTVVAYAFAEAGR